MPININLDIVELYKKFGFKSVILLISLFIFKNIIIPKLSSVLKVEPVQNNRVINIQYNEESLKSSPNNVIGAIVKKFAENVEEWTIQHYEKPDLDGFYCPKTNAPYDFPSIWNKENVSSTFNQIKFTYQIRRKNPKSDNLPSFVFSLGDDPKISKFYMPQKTKDGPAQYVGFQHIQLGNKGNDFVWQDDAGSLDEPVQPDSEVIITIKSQQIEDNHIEYTYILNYISALTKKETAQNFHYSFWIPSPDLGKYEIKWGFGVSKDSCIKITSYSVQ